VQSQWQRRRGTNVSPPAPALASEPGQSQPSDKSSSCWATSQRRCSLRSSATAMCWAVSIGELDPENSWFPTVNHPAVIWLAPNKGFRSTFRHPAGSGRHCASKAGCSVECEAGRNCHTHG